MRAAIAKALEEATRFEFPDASSTVDIARLMDDLGEVCAMVDARIETLNMDALALGALLDPKWLGSGRTVVDEGHYDGALRLARDRAEALTRAASPIADPQAISEARLAAGVQLHQLCWQHETFGITLEDIKEQGAGHCMGRCNPIHFYERFKAKMPTLARVAFYTVGVPPSAAACERTNSALAHIWSNKRASLLVGRVGLMAFIYYNQRVLDRFSEPRSAATVEEWLRYMEQLPPITHDSAGRAVEDSGAGGGALAPDETGRTPSGGGAEDEPDVMEIM